MTIDELIAAGFKEYTPNRVIDSCSRAWQKHVRRDGKRLFSIQVHMWDFIADRIGWNADAYLYQTNSGERVDVTLQFIENRSVRYVLRFFERLYDKLGCIPDPLNQD